MNALTTRTGLTALTAQPGRLAAAGALLAALVASTLAHGGVASAADQEPTASSSYVAWLLARADEAKPYTYGDSYVRTLVYWHHHPDWGFGS